MTDPALIQNDFLSQLTAVIRKNIANEYFGVSELAGEMNMSRSNLLRKVKKETKLSASQFISQVRLKHAMELLRKSSLNVSEVSHQAGFNSVSYFIKCFREYYGYPPGEVGKRQSEAHTTPVAPQNSTGKRKVFMLVAGAAMVLMALLAWYFWPASSFASRPEKSIAVLPFKNDSNDSTNLYLINGLMESTLNNLQQVKDLKVVSRTSTEKYRDTDKTIPEMAKELNVNYFVQGSGQKIGDQILLNIQLIEASNDKHLWAKQYRREAKDIFDLQSEVAKNIVEEIQGFITPEEKSRIEKKPTDDVVAYDYFLKGKNEFYKAGRKDLENALPWFKKAVEKDNKFALAYANMAWVYFYLDVFNTNKKYGNELNNTADKAMLFDPLLPESLIAKAFSYTYKKEYASAEQYLERALELNPNSGMVLDVLSDFYKNQIPNTEKYLEYALKGVRLNVTSQDSVTTSYKYLRLTDALLQTGFFKESAYYMDKCLAYYPETPYAWVRVFIDFAVDKDVKKVPGRLMKELNKDTTTSILIIQEIGKAYYLMKDFKKAYQYYADFIRRKETLQLDFFKHENLKIGIVLSKAGQQKKGEEYIANFKRFADNDKSIYKHLHLSAYYAYKGNITKATEHLKLFAKEDNYQYWILLWRQDMVFENAKDDPEFSKVMGGIETKFWNTHKKIRSRLEEEGLLQ